MEREMTIEDEFIKNVNSTFDERGADAAFDYIFLRVNTLLDEEDYDACDRILQSIHPGLSHQDFVVAILTIAYAAKDELGSYSSFVEMCRDTFTVQYGKKETDELLKGFTPTE